MTKAVRQATVLLSLVNSVSSFAPLSSPALRTLRPRLSASSLIQWRCNTSTTSRSVAADGHSPVPSPPDQTDCDDDRQQQERLLLHRAAETFMNSQGGYFSPINDTTVLTDDFVFRGPVIGPLTKTDYLEVMDYFRIHEAFPDISPNCFGFEVDPSDPLKVRFLVRATGTYQSPLGGFMGSVAANVAPPDGRSYRGSTEAWSILFDGPQTMRVRCITAGYVVDRFEDAATTGGRGLSFGILATLGIPFPTAPGSPALRLIQWLTGSFSGKGGLFPRASSDVGTVPRWWKDPRRGADV